MIKITKGVAKENIEMVYSHHSMQKIKHDHAELGYIDHPMVDYYSCFIDDEFVGCYIVAKISPIDYEVHMLLLPTEVKRHRELGLKMATILFEETDRISTIIIDGMNSAKNYVKKLGFKLEGVKREAFEQNCIKKDAYLYGLLKKDFIGG